MAPKNAVAKSRSSKTAGTSDTSSGSHDSTGRFTTPEEPASVSKSEDRKKAVREAMKENPLGVRLVNPMATPKDRYQAISGYLGLTETIPFRIIA